jgi:beta-glucosidase/6-phospho-beta-glucosidase/beta-galactosidase
MGALQLRSFFLGGFECSTHRLRTGQRLDLLASTRHSELFAEDYRRLQEHGICSARSGIRWHLIETSPYRYDFSSVLPMVHAANETGIQIIWDLFHYGWPDGLDIFRPHFVDRFAALAGAFAQLLTDESDAVPLLTPVNEISYFSWAAGEVGYMNPFAHSRGLELKTQLVRAAIAAMEAVWEVAPQAQFLHAEPLIRVIEHPNRPQDRHAAEAYTGSQYQAWNMLMGREWPQLGGADKYVSNLGLNYYPSNQWIYHGRKLRRTEPLYQPLRELLIDMYAHFQRPIVLSETGTEGRDRPHWLSYEMNEVQAALQEGVPIEGVCLYPILDHPGWDNDRHCTNGLWDYADDYGNREIYKPLAAELKQQQQQFQTGAVVESGTGELEHQLAWSMGIDRND